MTGLFAPESRALEAFDGRIQLHGFFESQLRTLAKGYSFDDGWDLAQWYQVLDLELELDLLRDDWGPFNSISGFVRTEVRYDCVWSGGCGMFQSVNTYGNQARRLPKRFSNGRRSGYVGVIRNSAVETDDGVIDLADRRPYIQIPLGQGRSTYGRGGPYERSIPGKGKIARIWNTPFLGQAFFALPGLDPLGHSPDGTPYTDLGRADDDLAKYPGSYVMQNFLDYRFGVARVDGVMGGEGATIIGPWRPIDRIVAYGALADRANPYVSVVTTPLEYDPETGIPAMTDGVPALAFRPATPKRFGEKFNIREAQGLYYPTDALVSFLDDGAQVYDQNFSQTDLAWNHGASQGKEQELREAYLDIDTFDGLLWGRFGKQVIVWGKTELFRAVDQFNPQDFSLASLPSLEESRTPLWAARMILSIGDFGPIQDFRIEGAVLLDQYEPVDIGRCGEPYSPNVSCALSVGLLAHAIFGSGLAGEVRPPDPWDDVKGLEGGLRIEWRAGRFSFSLSDYYGYDDLPYLDQVNVWERNVDPATGRPRAAGARGTCISGGEESCLGVKPYRIIFPGGGAPLNPLHRADVLSHHPANQQLFATICAATVGFALLPSACGFTVWNSPTRAPDIELGPLFSSAFGTLLTGGKSTGFLRSQVNADTIFTIIGRFPERFDAPLVELVRGSADGDPNRRPEYASVGVPFPNDLFRGSGLAPYLNNQQEALLGCGILWGNPCDVTGFDLFNTEASMFYQSWPGIEGTEGNDWDMFVGTQPGTRDFVGGPVCTRYQGGETLTVFGCEDGPFNQTSLKHPFFGSDRNCPINECLDEADQIFSSEMAALSFNALMTFVVTSVPPDVIDNATGLPDPDMISDRDPYFNEFDFRDPYRRDGCSMRKPLLCRNVVAFLSVTGTQRNTVRAGGNKRYGRRDFLWHSGAVVGLRHYKRNVLGFALDFAEDNTKTSWAFELSWLKDIKVGDFNRRSGRRTVDQINLVISVDRSTFINFLNSNRTFFVNGQLFLRYIPQHRESMALNGPVNALATLTIFTGYFQDRLNPSLTLVRDFQSKSGAVLTGLSYRYSDRFSASVGMSWFYGRVEKRPYPMTPLGVSNGGAGKGSYKSYVQNGLSIIRDRDEIFMRLRYTF